MAGYIWHWLLGKNKLNKRNSMDCISINGRVAYTIVLASILRPQSCISLTDTFYKVSKDLTANFLKYHSIKKKSNTFKIINNIITKDVFMLRFV